MLDLLLTGGTVVDGTGAAPAVADVGIRDGRVVGVGTAATETPTRQRLDVSGQVVAPGFVDVHTHYDAQIMWDRAVTPSSLHGVTTVLGGNCGFTMAPMTASAAEYLLPSFCRVEGMSVETLRRGLDLEWDSFASWLERLDGTTAVNAGFSVGHSTLRRVVMGEAAVGGQPSDADLTNMRELLDASLDAGALGFSSSWGASHFDHNGDPVPSRHADSAELIAMSEVLREHPGTTLEFLPRTRPSFGPAEYEVMIAMSLAAGRTLNWNLMVVRPGEAEAAFRGVQLQVGRDAAARGARVVCLALPQPMRMRLSLLTGVLYDTVPGWQDTMHLPVEERLLALSDPMIRHKLRDGAASEGYRDWTDWPRLLLSDVADPEMAHLVGRSFGDLGLERGTDPFDALLDLAVANFLQIGIEIPVSGDDNDSWAQRVSAIQDDNVVAGGSDAGAHLDMIKTWGCYSTFLEEAVTRRGLIDLAQAVHLITEVPARLYGLIDRGVITPGAWADLVVFDPATIGPGEYTVRSDQPAGGWRLYSEATGISHTFVNGVEIARDGQLTGATPGAMLRSGLDTQ